MGVGLPTTASLAIQTTATALALLFTILRVYVRFFIQKQCSVSDLLVILAILLCIAGLYFNYVFKPLYPLSVKRLTVAMGSEVVPDKEQLRLVFKLRYFAVLNWYFILWLIKCQFVLFYYSLTPKALHILRRNLHFIAVSVIISLAVVMLINALWCDLPVSRIWSLDPQSHCESFSEYPPYFTSLALHYATDLQVYIYPFFILRHLRLSFRQKVGVSFMFALGFLCIAVSVVRAIIVGTTFQQSSITALAIVENSIAIIVACCASVRFCWHSRKRYGSRSAGEKQEWGTFGVKGGVDGDGLRTRRLGNEDGTDSSRAEEQDAQIGVLEKEHKDSAGTGTTLKGSSSNV